MFFVEVDKKVFFIIVGDYVIIEDGIGIVYIVLVFGEDDYNIGKRYDLLVI